MPSSSSSTKKVAKAARSSGRRPRSGQGRNLGFPIAVAVIVLVGFVVTFLGRDRRMSAANESPRLGVDHWHAAFGIYACDTDPASEAQPSFLANLSDRRGDARGVHGHGDGVVHVHPFSSIAAGANANLGDYFYETDLEVSNGKLVLPSGDTYEDGQQCAGGQPGRLVLAEWDSANADTPPELIQDGISDVRFTADRMAFTLAFVPEGTEIPKPPSVPTLDNLSDLDPSQQTGATTTAPPADGGATTTTAAGATTTAPPADGGATTTTADGSTTTTAAADAGSTTTTAAGATTSTTLR